MTWEGHGGIPVCAQSTPHSQPCNRIHSSSFNHGERVTVRSTMGIVALWLLAASLALVSPASATTLNFELSEIGAATPQSVNSVGTVLGVTFDYQILGSPSSEAEYAASPAELAGGGTVFVDDLVLAGSAEGVLEVVFTDVVSAFSFGLAMDDIASQASPYHGFDITLFDDVGASLGTTGVDIFVQPGGNFWAEVLYSYDDVTSVKSFVLDFNEGLIAPSQFWLDDLTYEPAPGAVPEPSTAMLVGAGLVALALTRRSNSL